MLSESRARRYRDRARSQLQSNPAMSLEHSQRLLDEGYRDPEVLRLAGTALVRLRRFARAVPLLRELHRDLPGDPLLLEQLLDCYSATADITALRALRDEVMALAGERLPTLQLKIRLLNLLDEHRACLPLCEALLAAAPGDPEHHCMQAWHLQSCGELQEAAAAYRAALAIDPHHTRAHYALAQVTRAKPGQRDHIEATEASLAAPVERGTYDTASLHAALGKSYEDLEDYDQAFRHFSASAGLASRELAYGVEADRRVMRSVADWVQRRLAAGQPPGCPDDRPVFIVGLPRSGSTLLDRMLSSHSEVSSAGELLCFRAAVQELYGANSRGDFFEHFFEDDALTLDFEAIGQRYLELSAGAVPPGCRHYTDKMPMNYFLLGLIALALPNARFLHTVRNPMDSCFSTWKQLFARNFYNFSYDLENMAAHFSVYRELMGRWHELFPGRILDVHYEALVTDPRETLGQALAHCGLPWQDQCLEFHRNEAPVDTASAAQVRQPIYRSSVGKWRRYADHLEPLTRALAARGIDIGEYRSE